MARPIKVITFLVAVAAVAALAAGCGTQKITVPTSQTQLHEGAELFAQRCAGCHTLAAAATHGSANNVRDRMSINGPNFNVRCERPVSRVLYAIENGGFSGAYMPQNIVIGQDARDVAMFVSTYAGKKAANQPTPGNLKTCQQKPIGTLPASGAGALSSIQAANQTPATTTTNSELNATPNPAPTKSTPGVQNAQAG